MSRHKFRAWDKGNGKFISLPFFIDNIGLLYFSDGGRIGTLETSNYILSQYTGMKDKNGKEIYEGDIVEGHRKHTNHASSAPVTVRMVFEVMWIRAGFHLYYEHMKWDVPLREDGLDSPYEVIGNIYENKELLS